ncbi:MAG TPA: EBSC protein [Ruminococcaceae bacterium]|nr:EBSC protein [Oscillospiraceae bacterium]
MSIDKVKEYFAEFGISERVIEFQTSSATVDLAAGALNCAPERIAKTLSLGLKKHSRNVLVVTAGDAKIDNAKFKAHFGEKAAMLSPGEAEGITGHAIGGVCPFAINEGVEIFLDISLKRFDTVFPACGSSNSAIELTIAELEKYAKCTHWMY